MTYYPSEKIQTFWKELYKVYQMVAGKSFLEEIKELDSLIENDKLVFQKQKEIDSLKHYVKICGPQFALFILIFLATNYFISNKIIFVSKKNKISHSSGLPLGCFLLVFTFDNGIITILEVPGVETLRTRAAVACLRRPRFAFASIFRLYACTHTSSALFVLGYPGAYCSYHPHSFSTKCSRFRLSISLKSLPCELFIKLKKYVN
ncbi:hypothetical protein BpHYR1_020501 [Brachionus plicatilis]|uniref:Uncharacterized protein n=1 Tax=Brachionus plicatilis TaxID=10195 RepID=A0A3M7QC18_BRAPC|nr:hypothetical protein BpHYR1_020501 [Brachionus plicatilis]